jgi:type IX secretion system PorP/SprF family membrane protein
VTNDLSVNDTVYLAMAENALSTMDVTFGAMLYYNNRYFLGISSSQMLQQDMKVTDQSSLSRHYFISGLVKLPLNPRLEVIPSGMIKAVRGAPISFDVSSRLDWDERYFIGGGYRYQDAVTLMAGIRYKWGEKIKDFRRDKHRYVMQFYYSYDLTTSKLSSRQMAQRSNGTHEITIGFLLPPMYTERNAEDTWKKWRKTH